MEMLNFRCFFLRIFSGLSPWDELSFSFQIASNYSQQKKKQFANNISMLESKLTSFSSEGTDLIPGVLNPCYFFPSKNSKCTYSNKIFKQFFLKTKNFSGEKQELLAILDIL